MPPIARAARTRAPLGHRAAAVLAAALTLTACALPPAAPARPSGSAQPAAGPTPSPAAPPAHITASSAGVLQSSSRLPSRAAAVDFVDLRHGWAIGACDPRPAAGCAILATGDGGATWSIQRTGLAFSAAGPVMQFVNARDGFVVASAAACTRACPTRILATTDGGQTWHLHLTVPASAVPAFSAFDFVSATTGWAIRPAGLAETTDGGRRWTTAFAPAGCALQAVRFAGREDGWAGGAGPSGPCVYATRDGGAQWHQLVDGAHAPSSPLAGAFAAYAAAVGMTRVLKDPSKLGDGCGVNRIDLQGSAAWLVVGCNAFDPGAFAVLRSPDGGLHWSYAWGSFGCLMGCRGDGASRAPLDFWGADTAWRAWPFGVERTTDAGQTWTAGTGLCTGAQCVPAVSFVSADTGWAATGQGIFVTHDGGRSWRRQLPAGGPGPLRAVSFVSPATGYAVPALSADTVLVTHDGGRTWTAAGARTGLAPQAGIPTYGAQGLSLLPSGAGWAWDAHQLVATSDGGRTWQPLPPLPRQGALPVQVGALDFVSPRAGWLVSVFGLLLRTDDGGRAWTPLDQPRAGSIREVDFVDATHGFAAVFARATRHWLLLATDNAGAAWTPLLAWPAPADPLISFTSAQDGWLLATGGLLRTTDGGRAWTDVALPGLPALSPRSLQFVNASDGWVLTGDGRLLQSTDSGETWTPLEAGAGAA